MRLTSVTPLEQRITRNLRRERHRWDEGETLPMALGCVGCADREICGGIHKKQNHYWCLDDCCGDPATCDSMCPRNHIGFIERIREVNGLELESLPRAKPCAATGIPSYIPYLYHGNRRAAPLDVPAVALPLHKFYRRRDGLIVFTSRAEVEAEFRIAAGARIVLVGSGRDKPIEAWWGLSDRREAIIEGLSMLGVALVTTPNYSLFTDEIRYNDIYNMKRIGTAWQEFVDQGLPGAYHLNARTPRDYRRLASFFDGREEVTDVAFEFGTGAAWPQRRSFHLDQLVQLAKRVSRPLRLVMIGGFTAIPTLASAYAQLTYIDTSAFMSALHRQRLYLGNDGRITKRAELTEVGQPVDALLRENVALMQDRVVALISAAESSLASLARSEPQLENLETASSAPSAQPSTRAAAH